MHVLYNPGLIKHTSDPLPNQNDGTKIIVVPLYNIPKHMSAGSGLRGTVL